MTLAALPRPLTWWLTGLPAAGKTTLAVNLRERLVDGGIPCCVLDGDELRQGLCSDLDFSPRGRYENIRRVGELAKLLNDSGIWVVVALVSPYRQAREMARDIVGSHRFVEAHISTDIDTCRLRDPKGWYSRAADDPGIRLTGLQAPYEVPDAAEVVIDTARTMIAEAVDLLVRAAGNKRN